MRYLILLCILCPAVFGQAPDSVSGMIFAEKLMSVDEMSSGEAVLHPDGTYSTYFIVGSSSKFSFVNPPAHPPETGTYLYTKTGPSTATLTFTATSPSAKFANGSSIGNQRSGSRALTFNQSDRGFLALFSSSGTFRLSDQSSPLINASMRGTARENKPLILGFVINEENRVVLIRGIGPTLATFGVPNAAVDPKITLYRTPSGTAPDSIDDWSDARSVGIQGGMSVESSPGVSATTLINAFNVSGAFALPAGSKDAAMLRFLPKGSYTVHITTNSETESEVLGEVYMLP